MANIYTGEIRPWLSLTEEQQKSGEWLRIPDGTEGGSARMRTLHDHVFSNVFPAPGTCARRKTLMTPCVVISGSVAQAEDGTCIGCGALLGKCSCAMQHEYGTASGKHEPPCPMADGEADADPLTETERQQYAYWAWANPNTAKTAGTERLLVALRQAEKKIKAQQAVLAKHEHIKQVVLEEQEKVQRAMNEERDKIRAALRQALNG